MALTYYEIPDVKILGRKLGLLFDDDDGKENGPKFAEIAAKLIKHYQCVASNYVPADWLLGAVRKVYGG